jgi:hypothetical protein
VEFAGSISAADSRNYKAAMRAPDADKWKEAYNTEISTLIANGTWELVELPPDAKVINSGWVFKLKLHADGSVERHKGRIIIPSFPLTPDFGQYFYYNRIMSQYGALTGSPWDDDHEDDDEMDLFEAGGGDSKMSSLSTSKVVSGSPHLRL